MLHIDFDATAKDAALAPTLCDPVPGSKKTCCADFDPKPYGLDYLRLIAGDEIQDVEPPEDSEEWAYGCLLLADDRLSPPGWYPPAFAQ